MTLFDPHVPLGRIYKPLLSRIEQRGNRGVFAVDLRAGNGFWAHMEWALEILAHCDAHGLAPYLRWTSPHYGVGAGIDWFSHFFDQHALTPAQWVLIRQGRVRISHVRSIHELGLPLNYDERLTLPLAHELFGRYLRVRPQFEREADDFVARNAFGDETLGIHYRVGDKVGVEAPDVPWPMMEGAIRGVLAAHPSLRRIFISSDVTWVLERMRQSFDVPVVWRDDSYRSVDVNAPPLTTVLADNREKGRDALVNCMLLARCAMLVKTPSILSAWSKVLNPALPVVQVEKSYPDCIWFPERAILEEAARSAS